jgi:beta-N-acetylhexosaminidase
VAELCEAAQAYAVDIGNLPMVISIDQEGGPVARLGPPFTVFPGNRAIGEARSEQSAKEFGTVTAGELRDVGINMNLAPVLDVVPPGFDSVMADRVFGEDPELVASLGKTMIAGLQDNGMPATAKHFPGIGRTTLDSHADLPYVDTERQVLDETDLVPFRAAVSSGVEAVMLSHVIYKALDAKWPASLSSIIAKGLLRESMGFHGIVMTDDLDMGAIERHFDIETAVRRISDAEIDIALICHNRQKMERAYQVLLELSGESEESRRKASMSVQRILNLKRRYLSNV